MPEISPLQLADEMEQALLVHSLQAWFPRCIDTAAGGFHQDFARDWNRLAGRPRSLVFQARMTWAAATAARRRPAWASWLGAIADHGLAGLEAGFWDARDGGLAFWQGQPQSRHSYGVAFGLLAAVAAWRCSGAPAHSDFARRIFEWWDERAHDADAGGYIETLEPCRQGNDAIGTPFGQRSSSTLLHVLEALTDLHLAYPHDTTHDRIEECLALLERVVGRDGRLCRRYDAAWRPVDRSGSYGHDVEACVLARRARRALGIDGDSPLRHIAERALRRGYDRRHGGLFSGVRRGAFRRDTNKTWWVQAELLNYVASELVTRPEGAEETLQRIRHAWRFIADRQIDPVHGGWLASVSRDGGLVLRGDKGQAWKAIYHELRALLNAADALRTIGAGPDHRR